MVVKKADALIGKEEFLWSLIPAEHTEVHASRTRFRSDVKQLSILRNGFASKIQFLSVGHQSAVKSMEDTMSGLQKVVPSNDFGSYYKGLDEHGF